MYDTCSFYAKKPDRSRGLPEKGTDGKYHVDGKLEIAAKHMVSTSIPLLKAGGQCRKIFSHQVPDLGRTHAV
jgi:hypothetical protein